MIGFSIGQLARDNDNAPLSRQCVDSPRSADIGKQHARGRTTTRGQQKLTTDMKMARSFKSTVLEVEVISPENIPETNMSSTANTKDRPPARLSTALVRR